MESFYSPISQNLTSSHLNAYYIINNIKSIQFDVESIPKDYLEALDQKYNHIMNNYGYYFINQNSTFHQITNPEYQIDHAELGMYS